MPETLLKKGLWHRCFLVNFAKFLRTPFLQNTSGRLLLKLFDGIVFQNAVMTLSFCVGFTGNFPILYCCKDYQNLTRDKKFLQRRFFLWFGGFESSSENVRSFLSLGLESSISCNRIFFKSGFFSIFWARKVTSWNFLILGLEISVFRNIRKFRFLKYRKSFFKKI